LGHRASIITVLATFSPRTVTEDAILDEIEDVEHSPEEAILLKFVQY